MLPNFPSKWLLVVLRTLPLMVIVVLSAPAWICWPFLPERRQNVVLDMVKALREWSLDVAAEQERRPTEKPKR
ncbi:hypothetical protein M2161_008894 [Streptomyces sp. SAI-133]|jgi:hypothetical protein|nr:hypothetical protein [Streptomyces sp. SAI-133]